MNLFCLSHNREILDDFRCGVLLNFLLIKPLTFCKGLKDRNHYPFQTAPIFGFILLRRWFCWVVVPFKWWTSHWRTNIISASGVLSVSGQELQHCDKFNTMIHNSFLPITLTAKRSPLNSTDRSALALSSREILCTLTWNEHGNVHRGSFCSSVAGKKKKKKEATSTTDRRSKNTEGAIWLILCLINIHSLSWRGEEVTLHFRHSTDAFTQSSSGYSKALTQCDSAEIQGVS